MIGLFAALASCFRAPPDVNLYELVRGNWTRVVNNVSTVYPVIEIGSNHNPDGTNITTFSGEYEGETLTVNVTSNTTADVVFGRLSFAISLTKCRDGIAYGGAAVSDGSHVTVTAYANQSVELVYATSASTEIRTFGFFKKRAQDYTWKDFAIPTAIALVLTYVFKKVLPQYFG